jgi:hypothetical protein
MQASIECFRQSLSDERGAAELYSPLQNCDNRIDSCQGEAITSMPYTGGDTGRTTSRTPAKHPERTAFSAFPA